MYGCVVLCILSLCYVSFLYALVVHYARDCSCVFCEHTHTHTHTHTQYIHITLHTERKILHHSLPYVHTYIYVYILQAEGIKVPDRHLIFQQPHTHVHAYVYHIQCPCAKTRILCQVEISVQFSRLRQELHAG